MLDHERRINAELEKLTPADVFLRYHGATLDARRELANGHEPSDDDVKWMKMELFERMVHEDRLRCG